MVYDCFIFFNELDLLEIRLNELNKVIDKFLMVEANLTHQGNKKSMNFEEHRRKFQAFEDKIIYHNIEDGYPTFFSKLRPVSARDRENFQRECFFQGLKNAKDEDLIPGCIKENLKERVPVVFEQKFFRYFLNGLGPDKT